LVLFSGTGVGKRPVGVATPTGRDGQDDKSLDTAKPESDP